MAQEVVVIRGGLVVSDDREFIGDVVIINGRVNALVDYSKEKPFQSSSSARILDAQGLVVMPGGIDPHCHLNYPQGGNHIYSADDWYTGSVSAVCAIQPHLLAVASATGSSAPALLGSAAVPLSHSQRPPAAPVPLVQFLPQVPRFAAVVL